MNGPPSLFSVTRLAHFGLQARLKSVTGLTSAEYEVICLIGENPGTLRANISDHTGIDITSVSKICKRFKRYGWISCDGDDVRYFPLHLTQKGIEARSDLRIKGLALEQEVANRLQASSSLEGFRRDLEMIATINHHAQPDITRDSLNGAYSNGRKIVTKNKDIDSEKGGRARQGSL